MRKDGGRFWRMKNVLKPGNSSDDTQLTLATLKGVVTGKQWGQQFIYTELPVWSVYARGAAEQLNVQQHIGKRERVHGKFLAQEQNNILMQGEMVLL